MPTDKRVIIMRGLPGSGKSTKAKTYDGTIVSADDYFIVDGVYKFSAILLGSAHRSCYYKFREAVDRGDATIIVDNTNISPKEYKRYRRYAEKRGYTVTIDSIESSLTCEELAERNTHSVPLEAIKRMNERWQAQTNED